MIQQCSQLRLQFREMYEAKKWQLNQRFYTPMVEMNNDVYFLKEFVWFEYENTKLLGYLSSVYIEVPHGEYDRAQPSVLLKLIQCKIYGDKVCHTDRVLNVENGHLRGHYRGKLDHKTIGWKITDNGWNQLSNEFIRTVSEQHPIKKMAENLGF
ncbi:uncharacterized protein [Ptychodera flava]|uniref:uncharacterized protein n=1 Tax=Ptychodera flava TaxID=63121 RepID=UPI00396A98DC